MFQNHKQGNLFSFITGKVLGVFIKNFCIVLRTLSRIEWCNFCIENLNLEFVFVTPILNLFNTGAASTEYQSAPNSSIFRHTLVCARGCLADWQSPFRAYLIHPRTWRTFLFFALMLLLLVLTSYVTEIDCINNSKIKHWLLIIVT